MAEVIAPAVEVGFKTTRVRTTREMLTDANKRIAELEHENKCQVGIIFVLLGLATILGYTVVALVLKVVQCAFAV